MDTLDAAHQLAREYPGGPEALAPRLGKSVWTLRHELTRQGSSKFGLSDAEACTQFAIEVGQRDPLRILNTFARNCGARVFVLPDMSDAGEGSFQELAEAAKAFSDFVGTVAATVADGVVTANELKEVGRELSKLIGRAQAIESHLAAMHESSKPASSKD